MDASLLETGYRLFLCMTGALIAALLVRVPLRHAFGSRIAYGIWLLVPIAGIGIVAGSFGPMRGFTPMVLPVQMLEVRLLRSPVPTAPSSSEPINWIIIVWMLGAMLFAVMQWWQQQTFVRRLGVLQPMPNGAWLSESADIGPAVVGVFPPRMVLPRDFYQRFAVPEQTFALAHESMHVARRDPLANLIVAIVRSLFWFHPLVHLAVQYFQIDQEFACDADVLGVRTQDRHYYASAILKGQPNNQALPIGCRLDSRTAASLKRRFLMLQTPAPSLWRRFFGTIIIGVSYITSASLAWAIQSPPTPVGNDTVAPRLRLQGASSVLGNNDPIVIVDGMHVKALDQIDPNHIQMIEVLKGPSAVSLYGEDAASGVIVVTTKKP